MKLIEAINFSKGTITRNQFIDLEIPICSQEMELTEDMFQVVYNNYTIDIGWFKGLDCQGNFIIYLIKGRAWDKPIQRYESKSIRQLIIDIKKCIKQIPFSNKLKKTNLDEKKKYF